MAAGPLKVRCGDGWGSAELEVGDWVKLTPSKGRGLDVEIESGPPRCEKSDPPLFACEAEVFSFILMVSWTQVAAEDLV